MPKILSQKLLHKTKIFEIYDLKLEFDNGNKVDYEVLYKDTIWTAMIVPVDEDGNVLLIREYSAAINEYILCLPQGGVNYEQDKKNRTCAQAAQEELQEEAGVKAKKLIPLAVFNSFSGSINKKIKVFLAQNLTASCKEGDEPEELEVITCPLDQFEKLIDSGELQESGSIAALYLARRYLRLRHSE